MKTNIGMADRLVRLLIGFVIIALGIIYPPAGTTLLFTALGSLAAHYTIDWIYQIPQKLEFRLVNAASFYN